MLNKVQLEEMAMNLRLALEIDDEIILNHNHFQELYQKIENFEDFKIAECENEPFMVLEKSNHFTIFLCGNQEQKFYALVKLLCHALLIDKETITTQELQHNVFYCNIGFSNKEVEYLMRAFMMPQKAFIKAMILYEVAGDGSTIDMTKMQKEVNKYCYPRGRDLSLWS